MNIPLFVETQENLEELCRFLSEHDAIAVDTEFVWQRTYYPKLGIIQIATGREHAFIIDALAFTDLTPLREVMENPDIVKIFHDAHQDISIINSYIDGTVENVFDTQRAAGFTGRSRSLSLEKVIADIVGIHLAKSETRTNWLKRPLDPKQIDYAIDDVRYLPEIRITLLEEAAALGNDSFLIREMRTFNNIKPFDFEDAVTRQFKKVCGRIPAKFRGRAYRLVLLQELEARERDVPREHVIRKELISTLAATELNTVEDLSESGLCAPKLISKYGEKISEALMGEEEPSKELLRLLKRPPSDSNEMTILITAYQAFIHSMARDRKIDPTLLFNKSEVSAIVRTYCKKRSGPHVQGWRGELVNRVSEQFFTGQVHLTAEPLEELENQGDVDGRE